MRVLSDGRVKRSEAEWRALLNEFEASGLTEAEFCRREKVSRTTFIKWKQRLASSAEATVRPSFIELPALSERQRTVLSSGEFELSLPGGVQLRWKP